MSRPDRAITYTEALLEQVLDVLGELVVLARANPESVLEAERRELAREAERLDSIARSRELLEKGVELAEEAAEKLRENAWPPGVYRHLINDPDQSDPPG